MVLEEFWGDASSRTIDFRVARMRVATSFETCSPSFGSRHLNKNLSLAGNPFADEASDLGITELFIGEGCEVHHITIGPVLP